MHCGGKNGLGFNLFDTTDQLYRKGNGGGKKKMNDMWHMKTFEKQVKFQEMSPSTGQTEKQLNDHRSKQILSVNRYESHTGFYKFKQSQNSQS